MSPSEFHLVPVPVEDLEAVYELLAERSRARNAASSAPDAEAPLHDGGSERSDAKNKVWTEEQRACRPG